jgi:uncharacterized membrane protein YeaQ/YmgE (transglycosylase-associated protein family)
MNLIVWLVAGGLVGWVASIIMRTDAQQGALANILVGIVGAFLGGLIFAPMFGARTIAEGELSVGSLLVSLAGAVIALAVVNLVRRRTIR